MTSYLPVECKDGYIVKIANTDSAEDDYWVKFEADERGVDGPGSWVETHKPGIYHLQHGYDAVPNHQRE